MSSQPFRILSLNGGGVRALLQAHYLDLVSKDPLVGQFWKKCDLIIGTSAGSIVAGGLQVGKTPAEIATLFKETATTIFPDFFWKIRFLLGTVKAGNSVSNIPLKKKLGEVFQKARLGDFKNPHLAITATEVEESRIRVFSPLTQNEDKYLLLVDVVMASTALPGAFTDYAILDPSINATRHYVDGGLWANAPLLAAVALAVENGHALHNIKVISLGTAGSTFKQTPKEYRQLTVSTGKFFERLFEMTSTAAEEVAYEAVKRMIGWENVLHIDGLTQEKIAAWNAELAIRELPRIAADLAGDRRQIDALKALIN